MEDKNIDKLFREKLRDFEQPPPAYLLENVLSGVAGAKKKRKLVFWKVAGVAAALLLAFVAGWQVNYLNHESERQSVVVSQNGANESNGAFKGIEEKGTIQDNAQKATPEKEETSERQGHPRFLTAEDTSGTKAEISSANNSHLANRVNRPEKTDLVKEGRDDSPGLHPIKTIRRLMESKDQLANRLQEKIENPSMIEQAALTIDQQIIKQNEQQLMAQNDNQKNTRWLVGAQVSPAYSVNRSNHSDQYASEMMNSSSNTPVELGGGLTVEYKPGKRWSFQSGIYYAGLGQSSGNSSTSGRFMETLANNGSEYFNAPVNIQAGNLMVNSTAGVIELKGVPSGIELGTNLEDKTMASAVVVSEARFIQNFQYLEIPLYLRYNVIDARFDVELMGGVSSNVLVGNDTYLESNAGKSLVGKTQDMQGMNYSGTLGVGFKYGVSKRIFLNVEPRVKYYLNSLNNNSAVTYKPYTIGVFTGISYQF